MWLLEKSLVRKKSLVSDPLVAPARTGADRWGSVTGSAGLGMISQRNFAFDASAPMGATRLVRHSVQVVSHGERARNSTYPTPSIS